MEILKSSGSQQDVVANDVQEIKELLLRPHSPIPDYNPPTCRADNLTSPGSSMELPKVMLPSHSKPSTIGDIKIRTTLLHSGARKGDLREIREALRISQIDINAQDEDGQTALHICSAEDDTRIARYLCENHADVNVEDFSGARPLHLAAAKGYTEMVGILLSYRAVDIKDDDGFYAQDYANQRSDDLIAWMIELGSNDIEEREPVMQRTTVIYCTIRQQFEAVKYLIGRGANLEAYDKDGFTALMYASDSGNIEMVEILFSQPKSALNRQNTSGSTALMLAATRGRVDVLRLLLKHNPDLELSEYVGPQAPKARTAIYLALSHG